MQSKNILLSKNLGLSIQSIIKEEAPKPKNVPTHHIAIIDCSGSMYSDLPELRKQLKNKLPTLVKEKDTITLIWFSGKNQFGVIQEAVPIKKVTDLTNLNAAIDRFLQPVGLTGFKQPLEEAAQVIKRVKQNDSTGVFSLFFMTDGYDNEWKTQEILNVVTPLQKELASATFIEYGWNCNRKLLSQMAEAVGGQLVFNEHFPDYEASFENQLLRPGYAIKKIQVKLEHTPKLGYAFTFDSEHNVQTFAVDENNEVLLPDTTEFIAYFNDGVDSKEDSVDVFTYVGLATLAQRLKTDEIFDTLKSLADVKLINHFVNCFSKQDYNDFYNECLLLAFNEKERFQEGRDPNAIPNEDAYTVLDAINLLISNEGNYFYPFDKSFNYQSIGKETIAKDDKFKFTAYDENPGVPMRSLVYNEKRPNISVSVRIEGSVSLPEDRPFKNLPEKFPSFIYRNYTIIKDGIVHSRKLPVSLSEETFKTLQSHGLLENEVYQSKKIYSLDVSKLPIINRNMVKKVSAKDTFAKAFELEYLKGDQKVFKFYKAQLVEKTSQGYTVIYGKEATEWLKSVGLTDYSGFSPSTTSISSGDVYLAKEMNISVKGLSSLPKVDDVEKKLNEKKSLTLREEVMVRAIKRVQEFKQSDIYKNAADPQALLITWLDSEADSAVKKTRSLNNELAKIKFCIIVGHCWFSDMDGLDDNTLTIKPDGITNEVTVSATLNDVEISK